MNHDKIGLPHTSGPINTPSKSFLSTGSSYPLLLTARAFPLTSSLLVSKKLHQFSGIAEYLWNWKNLQLSHFRQSSWHSYTVLGFGSSTSHAAFLIEPNNGENQSLSRTKQSKRCKVNNFPQNFYQMTSFNDKYMHMINNNSLLRCGLGESSSDGLQASSSWFIRALAERQSWTHY